MKIRAIYFVSVIGVASIAGCSSGSKSNNPPSSLTPVVPQQFQGSTAASGYLQTSTLVDTNRPINFYSTFAGESGYAQISLPSQMPNGVNNGSFNASGLLWNARAINSASNGTCMQGAYNGIRRESETLDYQSENGSLTLSNCSFSESSISAILTMTPTSGGATYTYVLNGVNYPVVPAESIDLTNPLYNQQLPQHLDGKWVLSFKGENIPLEAPAGRFLGQSTLAGIIGHIESSGPVTRSDAITIDGKVIGNNETVYTSNWDSMTLTETVDGTFDIPPYDSFPELVGDFTGGGSTVMENFINPHGQINNNFQISTTQQLAVDPPAADMINAYASLFYKFGESFTVTYNDQNESTTHNILMGTKAKVTIKLNTPNPINNTYYMTDLLIPAGLQIAGSDIQPESGIVCSNNNPSVVSCQFYQTGTLSRPTTVTLYLSEITHQSGHQYQIATSDIGGAPIVQGRVSSLLFVDAPPPPTNQVIFTTIAETNGNFASFEHLDHFCDMDKPSGDTREYKAMVVGELSGITRRACTTPNCTVGGVNENFNWVLKPNTSYYNLDGNKVFTTNQNSIFNFSGGAEFESPVTSYPSSRTVYDWTGLNSDWTTLTTNNCNNWTSGESTVFGYAAQANITSWLAIQTTVGNYNCSMPNGWYCVSQ